MGRSRVIEEVAMAGIIRNIERQSQGGSPADYHRVGLGCPLLVWVEAPEKIQCKR